MVLAWFGGAAIVRLTGAAPVMLVLAAAFVLLVAASVAGVITLLRTDVGLVELPPSSTLGEPVPMRAAIRTPRPVWVEVRVGRRTVASGWADEGRFAAPLTMLRRGRVDRLQVRIRSAGSLGLVWWARDIPVRIADHLVAPRPHDGHVRVDTTEIGATGEMAGLPGASAGDVDGVRSWRDGDAEHAVHWPSTLRSGELVVRDRLHDTGGVWIVRPRTDPDDPDLEAGRALRAIRHGLRTGAQVHAAVGDGPPEPIADAPAADRWAATVDLGTVATTELPWWQRPITLGGRRTEPETTAGRSSRWWAAGATMVSIAMLVGALDYSVAVLVAALAGVAAGAAVSGRSLVTGELPSVLVRTLTGIGALLALVLVVAASGRLDNMLAFLRGPLPQVLIVLIVLHGFECRDRRTMRVSLAISAVVVMYAAGFRVDDRVGWWIAAWAVTAGVTVRKLALPTDRPMARRSGVGAVGGWAARLAGVGGGALATLAVLVLVPVPDGPARLTLPTFVAEDVAHIQQPGAVAGPDGEVRDAPDLPQATPSRAPAGQAGGYTGFAQSMDTSVRGSLSDEIVMRVRAPTPDYWRGQTFARFDGRTWFADPDVGTLRDGPQVEVPAALGDLRLAEDVVVDEFVQTYYLETDMPNVVFHAYRPVRVILDADVWTRTDGALRASTVLPDDSIYTVVSARPRVDATLLRRQGNIGPRLNELGRQILGRYLEVPASTTPETIALADELAAGQDSTYDVVGAYTTWLDANVRYDLDAPLPEPGEDAVHDFLFDTRLGFCEQIASALTIMLRTQGVPARLATGYLPGTRDRIAGVFEVRASDAHAWVEVWFPESGWQAFDPTASVPLSADARIDSLGADLAAGAGRFVERNVGWLAAALLLGVAVVAAWQLVRLARHRRARGRWGLLQDRFVQLASRHGAPHGVSNPHRANWWPDPSQAIAARTVAERLDRVAFDPTFEDDDATYRETRELVGSLGGRQG
jgi:transglutaminase-like putative cysteine protease